MNQEMIPNPSGSYKSKILQRNLKKYKKKVYINDLMRFMIFLVFPTELDEPNFVEAYQTLKGMNG